MRDGQHPVEPYKIADVRLGAIAQLEERLHGMQEVVGSSPTSSISGRQTNHWLAQTGLYVAGVRSAARPVAETHDGSTAVG
jgi:hypothetical protein